MRASLFLVLITIGAMNTQVFAKEQVKGAEAQYLYHSIGQAGLDEEYSAGIIHDLSASKIDCLEKKSTTGAASGVEGFSCCLEANGFSVPLRGAAAMAMHSRINELPVKIGAREESYGTYVGLKGVVCMIVTHTGNVTCVLESLY